VAPAIVISDMRMPGMSGIEMQQALLDRGRNIPFVFISAESTLSQGITAMKQGAVDFLIKPFEREELLAVVIKAMERDIRQMQAFIQQNKLTQALARLSRREKEVYGLLVQGYANQQIMDNLGIGLHTAKQYKSEVMRKLGVSSLAELIEFQTQQASGA
jgi:FixJ family two-component response regulator